MLESFVYLAGQGQAAGLIPPGSTAFHLLLAIHIAAALTCVVTGAIAALSPKRPGRHPRLGTLYYRSLTVVVTSAAWLAALRWPHCAGRTALAALRWPHCAGRRTPTCWCLAPWRLLPPPLAEPPGGGGGDGGAGAGSGCTSPA